MNTRKFRSMLLPIAAGIVLMVSACTKYPSDEELKLLDQQIAAADAAETKVGELEQEKASLEAELARQQKILADHEAEFEELKRRTVK